MVHRIFSTVLLAVLYVWCAALGSALPEQVGERTGRTLIERQRVEREKFFPARSLVAHFNEKDGSWAFAAKVRQVKEVLIYGKPGRIAQVEYAKDGEKRYAWAVVQVDGYRFVSTDDAIVENQEIILESTGPHVSAQGVRWDSCPSDDLYCQYARFVEGGFPASEDYNGLTICPSNMMIYSGHAAGDWINGMLAWRIRIVR